MFLLASIAVGFVFALLLGGRVARVVEVRLRAPWTVALALAIQVLLFSDLGVDPASGGARALHVASYLLLLAFGLANVRLTALVPVVLGMVLNAVAIVANDGTMPVSPEAARVAGVAASDFVNVSASATNLWFLGDVFALPDIVPFSTAFSVGDILIGFGMAGFIVVVSLGGDRGRRALTLAASLAPLRLPSYRRLLAGKLISSAGDWLTLAAVVGWIYDDTSSTGAVAGVLLARLAPPILGGSAAAYLVDRLPKERLLASIEALRAVAATAALAGVVTGSATLVLLALAGSGALAAVSAATTPAFMPSLVPPEQLPAANAGLGLVKNIAMALGAGGAGVAVASSATPAALLVDIATFVAAWALFRGLEPATAMARPEPAAAPRSAVRYLVRRRRLLLLLLSFAAATFGTGLANTTLPSFFSDHLGLSAGGYGFAVAALAVGLALGEVVVGFTRVGSSAGRWIGAGLLLTGCLLATLALEEHTATALLLLGLVGFVDGSTDILYDLVIQRETEPRYYGAVFGFSSVLTSTTMVTAFALAPVAARVVDSTAVIAAAATCFVVGGLIAVAAMTRARLAAVPAEAVA